MENGVTGQNILNVVKVVEVANKPGSGNVNFQVEVNSAKDQAMKPQPATLTLAQSKVKFIEESHIFFVYTQNFL